jgi:hypothetical protein
LLLLLLLLLADWIILPWRRSGIRRLGGPFTVFAADRCPGLAGGMASIVIVHTLYLNVDARKRYR